MATASLFIACKVSDCPRQLKDTLTVFEYAKKMKEGYGQSCDRSLQKNAVPIIDLNSFEFTDLKQSIVEAERFILKELGFKIWQLTGDYSVHS